MFIIGAVGIGMLGNATYGYIIFLCHVIGALINGILYRNLKVKDNFPQKSNQIQNKDFDLSGAVLDSALSIISVGTIITIFFVVITSLSPIFNIFPSQLSSVLKGMVEITKGCIDIATSLTSKWCVVASTFIISFGGISTMMQSMSMLSSTKIPFYLVLIQKLTHALISSCLAFIIVLMI